MLISSFPKKKVCLCLFFVTFQNFRRPPKDIEVFQALPGLYVAKSPRHRRSRKPARASRQSAWPALSDLQRLAIMPISSLPRAPCLLDSLRFQRFWATLKTQGYKRLQGQAAERQAVAPTPWPLLRAWRPGHWHRMEFDLSHSHNTPHSISQSLIISIQKTSS